MEIFLSRLMAGNSTVRDLIWSNFELILDFNVVLVTCKNEEDPIKNEGSRVATTKIICRFFRR